MKKFLSVCTFSLLIGCYQNKNAEYTSLKSLAKVSGSLLETNSLGVTAITKQSDGKIVSANVSPDAKQIVITRYLADGSTDITFSPRSIDIFRDSWPRKAREYVSSVTTYENKIYVAGYYVVETVGIHLNEAVGYIVKLNSDGTLDASFDTDGILDQISFAQEGLGGLFADDWTLINDIKVRQSDGKIFIAGYTVSGQGEGYVASYYKDGSIDKFFAKNGIFKVNYGDGIDFCSNLSIDLNDKLLVACTSFAKKPVDSASAVDKTTITRLLSNGEPDPVIAGKKIDIDDLSIVYPASLEVLPLPIGANVARLSYIQKIGKIAIQSIVDDPGTGIPEQKILISGFFDSTISDNGLPVVRRFNENGIVDTSFGTNGTAMIKNPLVISPKTSQFSAFFSIDSQERVILVFRALSDPKDTVAKADLMVRLTKNGREDTTFGRRTSFLYTSLNNSFITDVIDNNDGIAWAGVNWLTKPKFGFVAVHDGKS